MPIAQSTPSESTDRTEKESSQALDKRSSINVDHRTSRTFYNAFLQVVVKSISPLLMKQGSSQPEGSPQLKPNKRAHERTQIVESKVEDLWIYTFENNGVGMDKPSVSHKLYYFAGGGFTRAASKEHWLLCSEIAAKLPDYQVNLVSYPLAPNNTAEKALPLLRRFYMTIEAQAQREKLWITLMGDSAGGNIALSLGIYAASMFVKSRAEERCRLRNILAISPATDFRNQNPDIDIVSRHDPLLSRKVIENAATAWRGAWPSSDSQVSPVLADLTLLKRAGIKVDGVLAGHDCLCPDGIVFQQRLADAGVSGDWLHWERQLHCFPIMFPYHVREGVAGKEWILDVLRRNAHYAERKR